jgi:hypothetical protein
MLHAAATGQSTASKKSSFTRILIIMFSFQTGVSLRGGQTAADQPASASAPASTHPAVTPLHGSQEERLPVRGPPNPPDVLTKQSLGSAVVHATASPATKRASEQSNNERTG